MPHYLGLEYKVEKLRQMVLRNQAEMELVKNTRDVGRALKLKKSIKAQARLEAEIAKMRLVAAEKAE